MGVTNPCGPDAKVKGHGKDSDSIVVAPRDGGLAVGHAGNAALQKDDLWVGMLTESNATNVPWMDDASQYRWRKFEKRFFVNEDDVSVMDIGDKIKNSRTTCKAPTDDYDGRRESARHTRRKKEVRRGREK